MAGMEAHPVFELEGSFLMQTEQGKGTLRCIFLDEFILHNIPETPVPSGKTTPTGWVY